MYKDMSQRYKRNNAIHLKGFIESVLGDCEYYKKIKHEISEFRFHANVQTFLKNTDHSFDAAAKSLVYIYSCFDHNPKRKRLEPLLRKSYFFGDQTKSLMEYFREKYEESDFDLFDAIDLIELFMMNFGIKFEDKENDQLYCHVLDI